MALTETGEVFSWGDGDFGKLGHGSNERQRRPKQIEALQGEDVVQVNMWQPCMEIIPNFSNVSVVCSSKKMSCNERVICFLNAHGIEAVRLSLPSLPVVSGTLLW